MRLEKAAVWFNPALESSSSRASHRVMPPKRKAKADADAKDAPVRPSTRERDRERANATGERDRTSTDLENSIDAFVTLAQAKRPKRGGKAAADGGDGAKSNAQGKPTGDGDEESAREEEMVDGEDLDHRHRDDDEAVEAQRDADRARMLELLKTFTPSQMERYECYRRSNLSKPMLRRLFKAATGVTLNPNGLIILAGISKMFVGEMVETARDIMRSKGVNEYEEIRPEHLREAAAVIDARDGLMRRKRNKVLFARGYH